MQRREDRGRPIIQSGMRTLVIVVLTPKSEAALSVVQRGKPLICSHIGPEVPSYALCVPMMAQGEIIGVLYLDTGSASAKSSVDPISDSQRRMLATLTEHLALAVANLRLRESLRMQSVRDPLTDLYNRRYMEEALDRELRRTTRKNEPLTILMIDIDHFKKFNDSFGHEAGDLLL